MYLPIYFAKKNIFFQASDIIQNDLNITNSQPTFRKYWKDNYKCIKILKNFKIAQFNFCLKNAKNNIAKRKYNCYIE